MNQSDISVLSLNHIGLQGPFIPTNFHPLKKKIIRIIMPVVSSNTLEYHALRHSLIVAAAPEIFHIFKKHRHNRGEPSRNSFEICLLLSFPHINTGYIIPP